MVHVHGVYGGESGFIVWDFARIFFLNRIGDFEEKVKKIW